MTLFKMLSCKLDKNVFSNLPPNILPDLLQGFLFPEINKWLLENDIKGISSKAQKAIIAEIQAKAEAVQAALPPKPITHKQYRRPYKKKTNNYKQRNLFSRHYAYLQNLLFQYKAGKTKPLSDRLHHMADHLKITIDDLLSRGSHVHEWLERRFIMDVIKRCVQKDYPPDRNWLAIQERLRSPEDTIIFQGSFDEKDRDYVNGGHRFVVTAEGKNMEGVTKSDKRYLHTLFHHELAHAFESHKTRKGFVRAVRNICRRYLISGKRELKGAPYAAVIRGCYFTSKKEDLEKYRTKVLLPGYRTRESMFKKWEADLADGSDSEGDFEELLPSSDDEK